MNCDYAWHQLEIKSAIEILESTPSGLSKDEAELRKKKYGPNRIQRSQRINPWIILLKQFKDILIIILILATIISLFIGETLDASVIFSIVILCAILGFFQEYRSEKAVEALKKMAAPTARVIRGGEVYIVAAEDLVPGDIISLQTGDIVPADAIIIEAFNLNLNESVLTGESAPVAKKIGKSDRKDIPLGDRSNILFASTEVTRGRGKGLVVETGMRTEFGKIAGLLQEVKSPKTPLEEQMNVLGRWLGLGCLSVCFLAMLLGVLRGEPILKMFIWGVSLAVAAVPEALPAVVTSALAIGVQRMAKQRAIVKRLAAVETLGCTTVICTDKTGTLTKNEMTLQEIWIDGEFFQLSGSGYNPFGEFFKDTRPVDPMSYPALRKFLDICILCNDATLIERDGMWTIHGDPTEGALLVAGVKAGLDYDELRGSIPRVGEIPFEEVRKMMSTINDERNHDDRRLGNTLSGNNEWNEQMVVFSKGAPEIILEHCTHFQNRGDILVMTQDVKERIIQANREMAKRALRVLGLAWRKIAKAENRFESDVIEKDLIFCGLAGIIDPPRDEVPRAVKDCVRAGIKPVMVTGDHMLTAQAIARSVGIIDSDDEAALFLSGEDVEKMSDAELCEKIERVRVFARVSPKHKLRIVEAYQEQAEVVAMTGDGVNDAPALKKADIGVSMGIKGTDVSREASDMVLADDNFATIVKAVKEGRGAFENIKKYLIFLLSCNIGEILILAGAFFFGLPIPLIAIQILWVNLTTDGLPALALGIDPPEPDIMGNHPRGKDSAIFSRWVVGLITIISFHIFIVLFLIFHRYLAILSMREIERVQTMVFLGMILLEMFNAFNCRSVKFSIIKMPPWENMWLIGAVFISLLMSIIVVYVPFFNLIFHTQPLSVGNWFVVICSSSSIILTVEIAKWIKSAVTSQKVCARTGQPT